MSKIFTLAVGACAYVLGAKAGRERYEQIRDQARRLWRDPRVQKTTDQAAAVIKEKAPEVKAQASKTAKQVAEKVKSSSKTDDDTNVARPVGGKP